MFCNRIGLVKLRGSIMSGQLIELIIFAAIAFFIINKLLSTLGATSESDPTKNKTFFGESGKMKDVTNTSSAPISKSKSS